MAALTMERMARNILADPPWMKVFKNSYDSVEENLNKVKAQLPSPVPGVARDSRDWFGRQAVLSHHLRMDSLHQCGH